MGASTNYDFILANIRNVSDAQSTFRSLAHKQEQTTTVPHKPSHISEVIREIKQKLLDTALRRQFQYKLVIITFTSKAHEWVTTQTVEINIFFIQSVLSLFQNQFKNRHRLGFFMVLALEKEFVML